MNDNNLESNIDEISGSDCFSYTCSFCHTTFNTSNSSLKTCVFCGRKILSQEKVNVPNNYTYLPFIIPIGIVLKNYKKQTHKNLLLPNSFRGKEIIKKIKKLYVPCSLYNMSIDGSITFLGSDTVNNIKSSPRQTFECLYSTHFDSKNLLVSNFTRINDLLISNINDYDFTKMIPVDSVMTMDNCLIERNMDQTELLEKVQDKFLKQCIGFVRDNVGHDMKKISDNKMNVSVSSLQSVFIPIYYYNVNYNGREYYVIVNGQTGKMIVDVPLSKKKLLILSILCFILFVLVGFLITNFI